MLDLATVQQHIEHWIETFVEVPHPALGGWAPCPYARKARMDRDFEIRLGHNVFADLTELAHKGLSKSVVIIAYDPAKWNYAQFHTSIEIANLEFLVPNNLLALEDHPEDPEIVNGVSMNQGTYALALVQSLSDLNQKARAMASKGFYDTWPPEYLEMLFQHRQDPRA
jgi:hypothetical protein